MARQSSVRCVLVLATLSWLAGNGIAAASSPPTLSWLDADGSPRFSVSLATQPAGLPIGELRADRWFVPLPSLDVELLDGARFSFADARGSVLILDFFASWCEPCREELPHFQALYEARRDDGLLALAINVNEPGPLALQFAEELELTVPVGAYHPAMQPRLYGNALPTIVVADRQGRIRGRWDGYKAGYERDIEDLVDHLLDSTTEPVEPIAPVYQSDVGMRIRWLRRTAAPVEGLIASSTADRPALLAAVGRSLTAFESDGRTGKRRELDRGLRSLVSSDPARPWDVPLAGFRPGAEEIMWFDTPGGRTETLRAPARILDAAWLPGESGGDTGARLAVATTIGLFVRRDGADFVKVEGVGGVSSLGRTIDASGAPRLAALAIDGPLLWLDRSLRVLTRSPAPGAWRIIGGDAPGLGVGLAPAQVEAATVGRFAGGADPWVALALESELWLIDPRSGAIGFRAGWAGVKALGVADLDADGIDELVVAGENGELAVLELDPQTRTAKSAVAPPIDGQKNPQ